MVADRVSVQQRRGVRGLPSFAKGIALSTHQQRRLRNRPILVTGSHRSGTTWVGKMIASHPHVNYVQEPFNPQYPHPGSPVRYYFEHVTPETAPQFRAYLDGLMRSPANWWAQVRARPQPRPIVGATLRTFRAWWRRITGCRPLLKDPIALCSAEWIARTYDADVVVLIRHPAAFASSLKRLGLRFGFGHLLLQPALMDSYLQPLAAQIQACHEQQCAGTLDIIDEAIHCWRVVHHVIRRYQEEHGDWHFVRHEDLSREPQPRFEAVFKYLELPWTRAVQRVIAAHSAADNPEAMSAKDAHQLKLNSRANVWSWSNRLTAEEIRRIRQGTEDVAHHFYGAADWGSATPAAA